MMRAMCHMAAAGLATGAISCGYYAVESAPSAGVLEPAEAAAVQYERILGSFVIDPDVAVYLNPSLCERLCERQWTVGAMELQGIADRFAEIGARRGFAVASLNRGALLWFASQPQEAYAAIMAARDTFASIGDLRGLAHSLEWLGYMFRNSNAQDAAAAQLALAHRLFEKLGNRHASARVLAYGGP